MPRLSKKANLVKELESVIQVRMLKAYLRFYLDAEDRFEDELDYYLLMKFALLKSQQYALLLKNGLLFVSKTIVRC